MVVLDVTVPFLGRFEIHDDLSITDYSLLPQTTADEIATIVATMQSKAGFGRTPLDVLSATLSSLYLADPKHFIINNEVNVPPLLDDIIT